MLTKISALVLFIFAVLPARARQGDSTFTITIDINKTAQTIENIGASGCWYSEEIGKYWPVNKKEKIAELLFSRKFDKQGNPLGIGLSAWRFNVGPAHLSRR
jgi:hypothetical protein